MSDTPALRVDISKYTDEELERHTRMLRERRMLSLNVHRDIVHAKLLIKNEKVQVSLAKAVKAYEKALASADKALVALEKKTEALRQKREEAQTLEDLSHEV